MKVLTILGPSKSLSEDIKNHGIHGDVMAVNRVIIDYHGRIDYAVCMDSRILDLYVQYRKILNFNTDFKSYDYTFQHELPINTSGLLAFCVANTLGYDEIRVLGISADDSGHYYDLPDTPSQNYGAMFPSDNDLWIPELAAWTNFKVASGNLLKVFSKL